jgi:hypothetical protein
MLTSNSEHDILRYHSTGDMMTEQNIDNLITGATLALVMWAIMWGAKEKK